MPPGRVGPTGDARAFGLRESPRSDRVPAVAAAKSPDHLALGVALRAVRTRRGLTLAQLADLVKPAMNPRYISATERGEINISFGNLLRICQALDVEIAEVIKRYGAELRGQSA
jgi:DNA-binding Xre family transcriptional regulator